ncbi:MAG: DUF389 domain-containing protein [Actinobacteria bacterium]|nr:DUF389 domain-containing protein [Actinomycetota bacterium]
MSNADNPTIGDNDRVITVRVCCPADLSAQVTALLGGNPATSTLVVHSGASLSPVGDVIEADLPREAINPVVDDLMALGVQEQGTIQLIPVPTWISQRGLAAEDRARGASADAVVWTDVVERAYDESSLTWTYLSFMVLATLLAAIAIGLVRKRGNLFRQALRTLVLGFAVSITIVAAIAAVGRAFGVVEYDDLLTSSRPGTSFIYSPNIWSLSIAIIAGAAGVLALTSAKSGGLVGVFISVTTIPASGNIALALVFGIWSEVWGSTLTLVINIAGMALAGWLTLAIQQKVWNRVSRDSVQQ